MDCEPKKIVLKEILRPGRYFFGNKYVTISGKDIRHLHDTGNSMIRSGRMIPVPLEHQDGAVPISREELLANTVRHHAGWVEQFFLDGDSLWAAMRIDDDDVRKRLSSIRFVSPEIRAAWPKGTGPGYWRNCISHIALTTVPVWPLQKPFGVAPARIPRELVRLKGQIDLPSLDLSLGDLAPGKRVHLSLALRDAPYEDANEQAEDYIAATDCLFSLRQCKRQRLIHQHDAGNILQDLKGRCWILTGDQNGVRSVASALQEENNPLVRQWHGPFTAANGKTFWVHSRSGRKVSANDGMPSDDAMSQVRNALRCKLNKFLYAAHNGVRSAAANGLPRSYLRHLAELKTGLEISPCRSRKSLLNIVLG